MVVIGKWVLLHDDGVGGLLKSLESYQIEINIADATGQKNTLQTDYN